MPNWCSNHVKISHEDKEKIDAIQDEVEKEKSELFQMLRPRPPEENEGERWYSWNIEHWGTKWDTDVSNWDRKDDNTIVLDYDTAWGPSVALWEYMYEQGYEITAYYLEEGMAFAGKFFDGYDDCYNYGDGEELADDIDEFWGISERQEEEAYNRAFDDWTDYCNTLEKTEWFGGKVKPEYVGVYETQDEAWPFPGKSYWDGDKWCFYDWFSDTPSGEYAMKKKFQWRGITEDAHDEALLHDLKQAFDIVPYTEEEENE